MNSDKATPRPWRIEHQPKGSDMEGLDIIGDDCILACVWPDHYEPKGVASTPLPQQDNAELIITAVNQHEALVAVAEAAEEAVNSGVGRGKLRRALSTLKSIKEQNKNEHT